MSKRSLGKSTTRSEKVKQGHKMPRIKSRLNSLLSQPIFNVSVLILLLLVVFGGLRFLSASQKPGQVKFIEQPNPISDEQSTNDNHHYSPEIFQGEVYDTSIRLRETGALGMAISLAVFSHYTERGSVPPNLEKVWYFLKERNLMPPGFEFQNGEVLSPSGTVLVRYQSAPLRFEILSRPRPDSASPAILLRFPLVSLDGRTVTYFQSTSAQSRDIPAPFAPLEKIVSAGWTLAQWRGELVPKNENAARSLAEEKSFLDQIQGKQ